MPSKFSLNTHIGGFAFQGSLSFLQNLSNGVEWDRKVTWDAVHTFRAGVGEVMGHVLQCSPHEMGSVTWMLGEWAPGCPMILSEAGRRPVSLLLTLTSSQHGRPFQPGSEAVVIFARLAVV